jgi:hypothetical protein
MLTAGSSEARKEGGPLAKIMGAEGDLTSR